MERCDITIIGSGISGLSLAHYCRRCGLSVTVIEKSSRTGGTFHSHRSSAGAGLFWIEMGAHTCYNSYGNLISLVEECGLLNHLIPRKKVPFTLLTEGRVKSILSEISLPELLLSLPGLLTLKKEGLTVRNYYSRIAGKRNYEEVLAPAFNAVISQDAADFPADLLFRKRRRRKNAARSFTFEGGLQSITDALASEGTSGVKTGMEAEKLSYDGKFFAVDCRDGSRFVSAALALATPVDVSACIMKEISPGISKLLSGIGSTSVESVGVVVRKEASRLRQVAGIIPKDDCFFSMVSRDTAPDDSFRGFTFHFKPGRLDSDGKLARICDVLHLRQSDIEDVAVKENVVPSLAVGHGRIMKQVDRLLGRNRILLTGNYFGGLAIEDCVSRSLSEFERLRTLL